MNDMAVGFFKVLAITIACVAMYGCNKDAGDERAIGKNYVNESGVSVSSSGETRVLTESKKDLHNTKSLAKPGAAVKLKNTEPLYFATPGMYEYSLVLVSPSYPGSMTVEVATSEGVELVSSTRHFEFKLAAEGEYQLSLALNVRDYGRYYLPLHVTIDTEDASDTRVIAAILQVGDPTVKTQKAAAASAAKESDAIISLPAQETISPR